MNAEKKSILKTLSPLWKGFDLFRRMVVNIVFLVILVLILSLVFSDTRPTVPSSSALVVTPRGALVEELGTASPAMKLLGGSQAQTLVKDVVDAIDAAADDSRIKALVLELDEMGGAWMPKLVEIRDAVLRFKKSGKKVIATADSYARDSYFLAAHADEIYMHEQGLLILEGYGIFRRYYKEGIDKLELDVNVFRVGKYKSAIEPYFRNDMSEADRESNLRFLGIIWENYLQEVSKARGISAEKLSAYMDQFNVRLKEAKGNIAKMALDAGLLDFIGHRDLMSERMLKLVSKDYKNNTYKQIDYRNYLAARNLDRYGDNVSGDAVAVIVASGTILYGHQGPGSIGSESTAALVRRARNDKKIKAIVFRVDSPGGSNFASDIILRELQLARKQGIKVIVSMGSLAASGGYYVSMAADEIWAYPTTITGSIGIYGMIPTYQKPLAKYLGIHVDGVGTNKFTGLRRDRELGTEFRDTFQMLLEKGYADFLAKVADGRKMKTEDVRKIAQGRPWCGVDALELGLVDKLGGLNDALKSAAKMAKLGENFKVKYLRKKLSFRDRMIKKFMEQTASISAGTDGAQTFNPLAGYLHMLVRQAEIFSTFNDPNGLYTYSPFMVK